MSTHRFDRSLTGQQIPYHVKHAAMNQWDLPFSLVDYWFDKYYILVWEGKWLKEKVKRVSTITCPFIEHDNVNYFCSFINSSEQCFDSPKVSVSLRRLYGESTGYALLKVKGT